jgi:hypothetical protein
MHGLKISLVAAILALVAAAAAANQPYSSAQDAFSDAIGNYTTPSDIVGNAISKGWTASPANSGGIILHNQYGPNGDHVFIRLDPADYWTSNAQPVPGSSNFDFKKWENHLHKDSVGAGDPGLVTKPDGSLDFNNSAATRQAYDANNQPIADPNTPAGKAASHQAVDGDPAKVSLDPPPPPPDAPPAVTSGPVDPGALPGTPPAAAGAGTADSTPPASAAVGTQTAGTPPSLGKTPIADPAAGGILGAAAAIADCVSHGKKEVDCVTALGLGTASGALSGAATLPTSTLGSAGAGGLIGAEVGFFACLSEGHSAADCMKAAAVAGSIGAVCTALGTYTVNPVVGAACGAIAAAGLEGIDAYNAINAAEAAEAAQAAAAAANAANSQVLAQRLTQVEGQIEAAESAAASAAQACQALDQLVAQAQQRGTALSGAACGPAAAGAAAATANALIILVTQARQQASNARQWVGQVSAAQRATNIDAFLYSYPASLNLQSLVDDLRWRERLDQANNACPLDKIDAAVNQVDLAASQAVKAQQQASAACPTVPTMPATAPTSTPPPSTPPKPTEQCSIYELNLSGPSIWVGTESQRLSSEAGGYTYGGSGNTAPPQVLKQIRSFPNCDQAAAAWCTALNGSPQHVGYWKTTRRVYGDWVMTPNAPPCPDDKPGADVPQSTASAKPTTATSTGAALPAPVPPIAAASAMPTTSQNQGHPSTPPGLPNVPAPSTTQQAAVSPGQNQGHPSTPPGLPIVPAPTSQQKLLPPSDANVGKLLPTPAPSTTQQAAVSPGQNQGHPSTPPGLPIVPAPTSQQQPLPPSGANVGKLVTTPKPPSPSPGSVPANLAQQAQPPVQATAPAQTPEKTAGQGGAMQIAAADKAAAEKKAAEQAAAQKAAADKAAADKLAAQLKAEADKAAAEKKAAEQAAAQKAAALKAAADKKAAEQAAIQRAAAEKKSAEEAAQKAAALKASRPTPVTCSIGGGDWQHGSTVSREMAVSSSHPCTKERYDAPTYTLSVCTPPKNGSLAINGPAWTYRSNANFKGSDLFAICIRTTDQLTTRFNYEVRIVD